MASLVQVTQVLRCFSAGRTELTVTEASELLGLPKSTLSRLLRAMRDAGLLDNAPDSKAYQPGVLWEDLARAVRGSESFSARASAAVRQICDTLGHTGFVSALSGNQVLGIVHHIGKNPLQVGVPVGQPLAVDACATGRAMLAEKSDDEVRALLNNDVSRATPQSPQTIDELLQRIALVRARGYGESEHEAGNGVGALAVALRDQRSGQILSICVTFASAVVDAAERAHAIELLLQARLRLHDTVA